MKTIGIFHYQVGHTDGVSLEIDKWKRVLEEMGHTVHLCAGDLGAAHGTLIEEMYHHRPDAERLNYNTFTALRDYPDNTAYCAELYSLTETIERRIRAFVQEKGIDFLIPQNVWSVAANPAVGIALAHVMRDFHLPALAHNHDFYWERIGPLALTCATAVELADEYLPPHDPLAQHVVINSLAQEKLLARKGIHSTVIPNVFDFDGPGWEADDYNRDFRARIGLQENDVFILQATRIVSRKGIELAVDFVHALNSPSRRALLHKRGLYDGRPFNKDSRIVLVLAGYAQDDLSGYTTRLKQKIARAGVDSLFIEDVIGHQRQMHNGEKVYSLWDSYVYADFVTYPSLWEGWGNQFLEALRAKLPIMLFEYPVYRADIADKGFRVVSLGHTVQRHDDLGLVRVAPETVERAADMAVELLTDAQLRKETVEHNFRLGQMHYSLASLRDYLLPIIRG
ncbi:MAG: glycosyl transferase family 1 [Candidatus Neomarinimicrobiota bacterium]|nr:MAG: glycosyl transferase family 1 [Candidatus Neomarinimicrobiota bacterium]